MKKYLSILLCVVILLSSLVSCKISDDGDHSTSETTLTAAEDFQYEESENSITILKYIGNMENVVIPEKINGKPVTEIANEAFLNKSIVSVSVPTTVKIITELAFKYCKDLKRVIFNGNAPTNYDQTPDTLSRESNYIVYFTANAEGAPEFNEKGQGDEWCGYTVRLRDDSKFSMPYGDSKANRELLTKEDLDIIFENIPSKYYETYPGIPNKPLTATLYINGVAKEIDVNDARLVRMINLFGNTTYHNQYSFTPQTFSQEDMDKYSNSQNRLVLTYEAKTISDESEYGPKSNDYDTIVITTFFMHMNHKVPVWSDEGTNYSTVAYGCFTYFDHYNWLELFGFF